MDVIKHLQRAMVYIEDHLLEPFDLQTLSDYVEISPYHLEQSFTMIIGKTPQEYCRARRLTLAANDLIHGANRLIDLAKRYQYTDANTFAHDFSDYHGVSPLQAKLKKDQLQMQERLYLKLSTTSQKPYPYRLETLGDFSLVGCSRFVPTVELEHHFIIPDFLEDLKMDGTLKDIMRYNDIGPHELFVVSCPLEQGLEIFVGVPSERFPGHLEDRFLAARQYAVFNLQGEIDFVTSEAWHYIETSLQLTLPFERDALYIEVYPLDISFEDPFTKVQLCVPVNIDEN
ncbi:effector binding domain-containing protein [Staphylococcus intermedius]|uniref:AraC family transcriptional regulator n=1 Tax=Staphylococcus intermedius NCTC 11048 TaxID=1141106 RepID=A0A380G8E2_STAIN|nr:effector binding domain-containing protein [Staphylococcus intermedius]PCF64858.1 AraC family transcriptional regulator [Staphylococcus intermedius]PCF80468.1 AraC family transcriptional regulator [Staphylococcus intermedius]PCF81818.1 AraC family transcriptional regulator [Staphylococcus intermedius]PCF88869.1 AraC family transcriptional regulator [Staphylococcus intermedius]PNZ53225.1 AraC family transcriptional regulator [Staphylococcus intermedius NCTC 11048]